MDLGNKARPGKEKEDNRIQLDASVASFSRLFLFRSLWKFPLAVENHAGEVTVFRGRLKERSPALHKEIGCLRGEDHRGIRLGKLDSGRQGEIPSPERRERIGLCQNIGPAVTIELFDQMQIRSFRPASIQRQIKRMKEAVSSTSDTITGLLAKALLVRVSICLAHLLLP